MSNKQTKFCKECESEIPKKSSRCKNCGVKQPRPFWKNPWFYLILLVFFIVGNMDKNDSSNYEKKAIQVNKNIDNFSDSKKEIVQGEQVKKSVTESKKIIPKVIREKSAFKQDQLTETKKELAKNKTSLQNKEKPDIVEDRIMLNETISQKNAVRKAKSYLEYSAFSREGLIDQLKHEEFSDSDAVYGVDKLGVNWDKQAAEKAKAYLEYSAFSYSGLVEQLKHEGFTQEQAEYGVGETGL